MLKSALSYCLIILILILVLQNFLKTALASNERRVIPAVNIQLKKKKKLAFQPMITEISQQNIQNSPVNKLTELLKQEQSIARIETQSGDNTQQVVSIRGFGDNASANSLILIDGFPLTQPSLFAPNLNSLLLSDLKRIDIFQGSNGTLWGNQAIGGVMNIMTRHPEKKTSEIKASIGDRHSQFYSFAASSQLNNGIFAKISGFTNQTDHYRAHNQEEIIGFFPKAGMTYAKGLIDARWQYNRDLIYFPGGLTEEQYLHHPEMASNRVNFSRYQSNTVQLLNQHAFNTNWLGEIRLQHQDLQGSGIVGLAFNRREGGSRYSPRLIGSVGNKKIILGYDGQFDQYQFENKAGFKKASINENDVYAEAVLPIFPLWNDYLYLTLGSRYALQHQELYPANSPNYHLRNQVWVTEQGLSFSPDANWQVFIRRDENFRFPKATEVLWTTVQNRGLSVQQGVSYEAGSSWQFEKENLQVTLYSLTLHNEIAFDPTQNDQAPFGAFYQFDQTNRRGISIAHTHELNDQLKLISQINYVKARYADKQIPAVPAWNGNIGVNYQLTSVWRINYAALYTGSRYASEDNENIGKKQSSYWLHNMAVQYTYAKIRTAIEIANILDQRYAVYTIYNPAARTNTYYPGAGRSYLFTVEVEINE